MIILRKVLYFFGLILTKIKYLIYRILAIYNTDSVNNNGGYISGQTILANPQNIYIGKGSSINGGQVRAGKKSKIVIGENCIISYNVHIRADSHYYDRKFAPINEQGNYEKDIIIGNDVWIGYGAQIMPGIKIGDGSIIGTGSIVTHDVKSYEIVAGVPARKIKDRKYEKK